MSSATNELSTSDIIEAEAKRLAPQMLSRLSEPVDAAIERIAKRQGLSREEVVVEMWDAVLGEIYSSLSLVP
jgi:hypothetical protein